MSEPREPTDAAPASEPEALLVAQDDAVSFEQVPLEGWAALGIFWLLGLTVLYQFFTRYALNDSAAWTEEIARYLLICTVFVGAAAGVRAQDHIRVDLAYRHLSRSAAAALALAVDALSVLFYVALVVLSVQMMQKLGDYRMTVLDLPMNVVFGVCALAFAAMALRAAEVLRRRLREARTEAPKDA